MPYVPTVFWLTVTKAFNQWISDICELSGSIDQEIDRGKDKLMKIATMATGGIGGFLAVKLADSGHEVATIARGEHLRAIQENGLILDGVSARQTVHPWMATDNPEEVGVVDAIIFGVKGDSLEAAATACLPMVGDDTVVVPFLNGVEAADRLTKILPEQNVAIGVAQVSTTISEPGVIKQTGELSRFIFAERDSRPSKRIDALRKAINESGTAAPPTDDVERDLWSKFVLFSAVSGVTAVGRCTMGDVSANEPLAKLFQPFLQKRQHSAVHAAWHYQKQSKRTCGRWQQLRFPPHCGPLPLLM